MKKSDCVLYLLNEPAIKQWVHENNPRAIGLEDIYYAAPLRQQAYMALCDTVIEYQTKHEKLCFLLYGHPAVFSSTVNMLVNRLQGRPDCQVQILPGISALDCLFADLNIDPAQAGMQSYDATEFLLADQAIHPDTPLFLWQIGVLGLFQPITEESTLSDICQQKHRQALNLLTNHLLKYYPDTHKITLYTAAQYPGLPPETHSFSLAELANLSLPRLSILYIPTARKKSVNQTVYKLLYE